MKKHLIAIHRWLETLPDTLFPFRTEIDGQLVRGRRAYQDIVKRHQELFGVGRFSKKIVLYRGAWHIAGAILFLTSVTLLASVLAWPDSVIMSAGIAAMIGVALQEIVLHPRRYNQTSSKTVIDICTWCVPIGVFLLLL